MLKRKNMGDFFKKPREKMKLGRITKWCRLNFLKNLGRGKKKKGKKKRWDLLGE
jgi:hypothetical protein